MNLLIDIGNTRIKWAFDNDGELCNAGQVVHRDDVGAAIAAFAAKLTSTANAAFAANVAGEATGEAVAAAVRQMLGCDLEFVATTARIGPVSNGYVAIDQLGVDRWAAIVAAWGRHRDAVCVVDAGSALTVDLVARNGEHLGGVIVPGVAMLQSALLADTSNIAGFAARASKLAGAGDWYGRDTASAVARGSIFAAVSLVEAAVAGFPVPDSSPRLVLTGGDAPLLLARLRIPAEHRPDLVLEGVRHLAAES